MQILIRKSIKTFQKPLITIFFRIFHINLLFIMKFHLFFRSKKTTELQKNKLSKKAINLFWENLIENENRQIYYDSDVISMWSFLIYTLMWRKKKLADKMWWKYKKQDTHILSFMLSNNLDECKNMKTQFETRVTKKLSKPINYLFKARNHIFLDYLTIRLERVNPSVNFHLYSYRNIDDHNISLYILWLPGFIYLILVDFSILFFNVKSGFSFVRKMRFWYTNEILYCMGFLTSIWFVLLSLYSQSLGIYQFFIFQRKKKRFPHNPQRIQSVYFFSAYPPSPNLSHKFIQINFHSISTSLVLSRHFYSNPHINSTSHFNSLLIIFRYIK